jgi:sugar/nucleoside kinase (ribokinase family)
MRRARVLSAGEALVDWVCTDRGVNLALAGTFTKAPGGAPFNLAVALARLGVPTAFAGRVGADPFGTWLRALLDTEGVDTALMTTAHDRQTRMAYVVTNREGDRELAAFSDVACADAALTAEDLPEGALDAARVFYFGSLILQGEPSAGAVIAAARRVHAGGGLSVFDPNIRPVLWPEEEPLRAALDAALGVTDLVKLSVEELAMVAGPGTPEAGAATLLDRYGLAAVVVTDGAEGAGVYTRRGSRWVESCVVEAVEPTGAGDGFLAGLIASLLAHDDGTDLAARITTLPDTAWDAALRRACAVGALATTRAGAITALPTADELEAFLAAQGSHQGT